MSPHMRSSRLGVAYKHLYFQLQGSQNHRKTLLLTCRTAADPYQNLYFSMPWIQQHLKKLCFWNGGPPLDPYKQLYFQFQGSTNHRKNNILDMPDRSWPLPEPIFFNGLYTKKMKTFCFWNAGPPLTPVNNYIFKRPGYKTTWKNDVFEMPDHPLTPISNYIFNSKDPKIKKKKTICLTCRAAADPYQNLYFRCPEYKNAWKNCVFEMPDHPLTPINKYMVNPTDPKITENYTVDMPDRSWPLSEPIFFGALDTKILEKTMFLKCRTIPWSL